MVTGIKGAEHHVASSRGTPAKFGCRAPGHIRDAHFTKLFVEGLGAWPLEYSALATPTMAYENGAMTAATNPRSAADPARSFVPVDLSPPEPAFSDVPNDADRWKGETNAQNRSQ